MCYVIQQTNKQQNEEIQYLCVFEEKTKKQVNYKFQGQTSKSFCFCCFLFFPIEKSIWMDFPMNEYWILDGCKQQQQNDDDKFINVVTEMFSKTKNSNPPLFCLNFLKI